jgi:hypothetical protein
MSLSDWLAKLEERGGRCDNYREWGPRVVSSDWRTNLPIEPAMPQRCPNCGFSPATVRVEEVHDWRGGRRTHPQ